jgi:hypothetical protein
MRLQCAWNSWRKERRPVASRRAEARDVSTPAEQPETARGRQRLTGSNLKWAFSAGEIYS